MSCFRLPSSVCSEIEKECANFWWGVDNGRRKLHWKSWDFLCNPKSRGGLGFRKLIEFNRALLAKQVWRLIRYPESLVARVLKGRYYRHQSVLTAGVGSNPSFIWRLLHWGKDLLANGLIWRVGDGKSIQIFDDLWIPTMQSKISRPVIPGEIDSTVDALIKDGQWDAELIALNFNPYVAGEILKIPLPTTGMSDSLFWRYEAKGQYVVRDGCRLQRGLFSSPEHQAAHSLGSWWAFIWILSIPPKIRLFWWSISHDCIPTNQNLMRHHVPVSESCSLCNSSMDSTFHSLIFCPAIKYLWKNTSFVHVVRRAIHTNTLEICLWLKENLSRVEFEELAIHAWAIWKEKQNLLHGDRRKPMANSITWSAAMLADFRNGRLKEGITCPVEKRNTERTWKPPRSYSLKLNVDTAVNVERHMYSIGGVVRDSQGRLLLAFGKQINQPLSVVHGELLAIREGIKLLYERGFQDVQIASDSLLAVQAVTTNQEDLGYTGFCTADIMELMKKFAIAGITHVLSSANKVAHNMARFAFSSRSPVVWVNGEFPFWLVQLVNNDLMQ